MLQFEWKTARKSDCLKIVKINYFPQRKKMLKSPPEDWIFWWKYSIKPHSLWHFFCFSCYLTLKSDIKTTFQLFFTCQRSLIRCEVCTDWVYVCMCRFWIALSLLDTFVLSSAWPAACLWALSLHYEFAIFTQITCIPYRPSQQLSPWPKNSLYGNMLSAVPPLFLPFSLFVIPHCVITVSDDT